MYDFWKMRRRFTTRCEIESLLCRTLLVHSFARIPADDVLIPSWTIDIHDPHNIASGFDPYFYLTDDGPNHGAATLTNEGLTLTTAAVADGNDVILSPIPVATVSLFRTAAALTPSTGKTIRIAWALKTGSTLTAYRLFVGAMTTIESVISTTAAHDAAVFFYDLTYSANWQFVIVKNGVPTLTDTGIRVLIETPYLLELVIRPGDYRVEIYINSAHVSTTVGTVDSTKAMYPMLAVETGAAAAKHVHVRGVLVELEHGTT